MQQTLDNSLVNRLDCDLVSSLSGSLVAGHQSGVELLQVGLQLGLVSLVLLISDLGRNDILLRGLNVGHGSHLLLQVFHTDTHYSVFAPQNQPPFLLFFLRISQLPQKPQTTDADVRKNRPAGWCGAPSEAKKYSSEYTAKRNLIPGDCHVGRFAYALLAMT